MDFSGLKIPDLDGKAVLITGASTGIGAACAKVFAAQGCKDPIGKTVIIAGLES